MDEIIKINDDYKNWIRNISDRYRSCQIKAAVRVNEEMLKFYWSLGRDMEKAKSSYDWGSHFYSQISKDLKKLLPDAKSFSPRNLLYMNQFYRLFSDEIIAKQVVSQLEDLAKAITKDPYNFDFLTLRENYDEKELKDALMSNIQDFLLELGKGFAFVGREYRLLVGETEQFLDMLFYNIQEHCYVVVEVKTWDFEPADMGQLSAAHRQQNNQETDNGYYSPTTSSIP